MNSLAPESTSKIFVYIMILTTSKLDEKFYEQKATMSWVTIPGG